MDSSPNSWAAENKRYSAKPSIGESQFEMGATLRSESGAHIDYSVRATAQGRSRSLDGSASYTLSTHPAKCNFKDFAIRQFW